MGWASRNRAGQGTARDGNGPARRSRRTPKEDPRLSERLVDLIAPYREESLTRKHYETLISAAAVAWNLALLPADERAPALGQAFRKANVNDIRDPAELIVALMRRKEELFPDDDRVIVHWEVWETDNEYHVTVASADRWASRRTTKHDVP